MILMTCNAWKTECIVNVYNSYQEQKFSEILKNKNKIFTILPASTLLCFHIKEVFYKNKIPASFHIFTEFYDI